MWIRTTLLIFVLNLLVLNSPVKTTEEKALRFGQSKTDFIQLSSGIMDNHTEEFSICSWIKKRFHGAARPIVVNYRPGKYDNSFVLGDDGYFNSVVGDNLNLEDKFSVRDGLWSHICWTWTTKDYTTRVYLDGNMIGSKVTAERKLGVGGRMSLGINAGSPKHSEYVFGGDLFKLNIYDRVLDQSEIETMSADMCSTTETSLSENSILSWEEILTTERSGSVTDLLVDCRIETLATARNRGAEKEVGRH